MKLLLLIFFVLISQSFAQSILLSNSPKVIRKPRINPAVFSAQKLNFVEFRNASIQNILKLLKKKSPIKVPEILENATQITLRLEDISWQELERAVFDAADRTR